MLNKSDSVAYSTNIDIMCFVLALQPISINGVAL